MLIHFTAAEEQELYDCYLFGLTTGEWEGYNSLSPTQELCIFYRRLRGAACG